MMFSKNKNLNYALIGVIFVIIAGIIAGSVYYFKQGGNMENDKKINSEEEILNSNKNVINDAENQIIAEIPPISDDDHILGSIDAPVQFIIYSDFECPFCADFSDTVKKAKDEFGDDLVIVYRHFPLATHLYALTAAVASECADEQGKFWEMHDKLFENNKSDKIGAEQFKQNAIDLELDAERFNKCLDEEKYKDKVNEQMLAGKNAGILGTPQSFINDQPLPGAYPYEDFTDSGGFGREGIRNIIMKNL